MLLGIYEDTRFKSEAKKPSFLKCLDFLGLGSGPEFEQKFKHIQQVCSGVILSRQLVNAPANVITPSKFMLFLHVFFSVLWASHIIMAFAC